MYCITHIDFTYTYTIRFYISISTLTLTESAPTMRRSGGRSTMKFTCSSHWCNFPCCHISYHAEIADKRGTNKVCVNTRHVFTTIRNDDHWSKWTIWLNNLPPFSRTSDHSSLENGLLKIVQEKTIVWLMPRLAENIYRNNLWSASRVKLISLKRTRVRFLSVSRNFHLAWQLWSEERCRKKICEFG